MEFFCLKSDKRCSDAPVIQNWYGKLNEEHICKKNSYLLPKRELFEIRYNPNVFFPDILVFPYFLVSNTCKEVISVYEPNTIYKQIVLLDVKAGKCEVYNLPILERIDDFSNCGKCLIGRQDEKLRIKAENIRDLSIFQVRKNDKIHTVVRLDMLESFLRRGATGVIVEEVIVEG